MSSMSLQYYSCEKKRLSLFMARYDKKVSKREQEQEQNKARLVDSRLRSKFNQL